MKSCPNCGAMLVEDELYCENCGFDPSFDTGDWDYGGHQSSTKPYLHGEHIKSSQDSENWVLGLIMGLLFLGIFIWGVWIYMDMYNWNLRFLIWSNLQSIFLLIIVVMVFGAACHYFNNI